MFTLLGSLLGFFTSFLPKVMDYAQDRADKAHELRVMELQIAAQRESHGQRLEEINVEADIREFEALQRSDAPAGVKWIDGLRASVRPVITYAFFALFLFVEAAAYVVLLRDGAGALEAAGRVWDDQTKALFAAVMSFWFGNRAIEKYRAR